MEIGRCKECGLEMEYCDFLHHSGDETIEICPQDEGGCGSWESIEIIEDDDEEENDG